MSETEFGTVVLDIGGDVGALILFTDAAMNHVEIEIMPNDEQGLDVFQAEHPHEAEPVDEHSHTDEHTHEHTHDEHTHEDGHTHAHTHAHTPGTTHVAVQERRFGDTVRYSAIYPGLREGSYTLLNQDGTPADVVQIIGGRVVQVDWR